MTDSDLRTQQAYGKEHVTKDNSYKAIFLLGCVLGSFATAGASMYGQHRQMQAAARRQETASVQAATDLETRARGKRDTLTKEMTEETVSKIDSVRTFGENIPSVIGALDGLCAHDAVTKKFCEDKEVTKKAEAWHGVSLYNIGLTLQAPNCPARLEKLGQTFSQLSKNCQNQMCADSCAKACRDDNGTWDARADRCIPPPGHTAGRCWVSNVDGGK